MQSSTRWSVSNLNWLLFYFLWTPASVSKISFNNWNTSIGLKFMNTWHWNIACNMVLLNYGLWKIEGIVPIYSAILKVGYFSVLQSWSKVVETVVCNYHLADISWMKQQKNYNHYQIWTPSLRCSMLVPQRELFCCKVPEFGNYLSQQTNIELGEMENC